MDPMRGPVASRLPDRRGLPRPSTASSHARDARHNRGGGGGSHVAAALPAARPPATVSPTPPPTPERDARSFTRAIATLVAVVLLAGAALLPGPESADAGGGVTCRIEIDGQWHYGDVPHRPGLDVFEVCEDAQQRGIRPSPANGHTTTLIRDHRGDTVPGDQPAPAVIYDSRRSGRPLGFYEETSIPVPGPYGTHRPDKTSTTQPVSPDFGAFNVINSHHRAVCDDDGCYREYRSAGEWRRSASYGTGGEALLRATWNAYWRSRGEQTLNPTDGRWWARDENYNRLYGANPPGTTQVLKAPPPIVEQGGSESAPATAAQSVENTDCTQSAVCPEAPSMTAQPGPGDSQIRITWTPASSGRTPTHWDVGIRRSGTETFTRPPLSPASARSYTFITCNPTTQEGVGCGQPSSTTYDVEVRGVYTSDSYTFHTGDSARATGVQAAVLDSVTLVRNSYQVTGGFRGAGRDYAQAFTTGDHAEGYQLTSVGITLNITTPDPPATEPDLPSTYTVEIWTVDSATAKPDELVATLTNPTTLETGHNTFSASSPVALSSSTTYAIVYDLGSSGANWRITTTQSDAEDAGWYKGWSIGDGALYRDRDETTQAWSAASDSLKIGVYGYPTGSR